MAQPLPDDVMLVVARRGGRTELFCRACFLGCECTGQDWAGALGGLPCRPALMEYSMDERERRAGDSQRLSHLGGELARQEQAMARAEARARADGAL